MKQTMILSLMLALFLGGCGIKTNDTSWPEITAESKPWTRWWWMGMMWSRPD